MGKRADTQTDRGASKGAGAASSRSKSSANKPARTSGASGAKSTAKPMTKASSKPSAKPKPAASSPKASATRKPSAPKSPRKGTNAKTNARSVSIDDSLFTTQAERRAHAQRKANTSPSRAQRKPSKKRSRRSYAAPFTLLLLLVLSGIGAIIWRVDAYEAFSQMKAVVSQQTFYAGTSVEGVDVSQMTLSQALEHWDTQIEPQYRNTQVSFSDGTRVTAQQLGYESNFRAVLTSAWNAGRKGSLEQRYKNMQSSVSSPQQHAISRSMYDEAHIQSYVDMAADRIDVPMREAKLVGFNVETYAFEFERDQKGQMLDRERMSADLRGALSMGGGAVTLNIQPLIPQLTMENANANYGMLSYAVTNASSSSSNRLSNIKLALSLINGTRLEPGQTFSFNDTVGRRTQERGFKLATAYSSGKVTEEIGGGICQVSTTLFNAAVKADLSIKERHAHSLTVSYVDLGKDAAVDWGNKDLKITNSSSEPVYICCYLTEDKRIRFGIFGKLTSGGGTIVLEGVTTNTEEPQIEYQLDFNLNTGETKEIQKGKKGYAVTTYKIWRDAQENELRREELCKSRYKSSNTIVAYGA